MKKTANLTLIIGGKPNLDSFQTRQTRKKIELEREAAEAKRGSFFMTVEERLMNDMWGLFLPIAVVAGTAAFIGLVLLIVYLPGR